MRETVYQFSNPSVGINFFTADEAERDSLINSQPDFNFLGASYFSADPANSNSSPVFRLFNRATGSYFYTIDAAERDNILGNNPNFIDQGEAFPAFASQTEGTEEVYRFFNSNTGTHFFTASETERQSLEANPNFQFEGVAFYTPPVAGQADTPPSEDPIAARGTGVISGFIFNDVNRSGVRDSNLVQGANPDLVFVIDVSGSTGGSFGGTPVGDVNGDGRENDILDAELAGFIALNQQLRDQGLGDNVDINVVVFGSNGVSLNMVPGAEDPSLLPEGQAQTFSVTPNTDTNGNGIPDINEILSSVTDSAYGAGGGTDFRDGLQASSNSLNSIGTISGEGNVIFLSDGGASILSDDEVLVDLRNNNVNVSAFGVGEGADIDNLREIDPLAQRFTSTDEFLSIFGGDDEQLSQSRLEPPQQGIEVYLDRNNNGVLDNREPTAITDENGVYQFNELAPGTYTVRQVNNGFDQTLPGDPAYTVELGDGEIIGNLDFGNAPIARDNFTGASLQVQAFAPDLNTPFGNAITTTVNNGVEFDNLTAAGVDDTSAVNVDIDLTANSITLTVDSDDGSFGSGTFNGYRFRDFSNSIAPINDVTINADATTLGVQNFDINFTTDIIEIDLAGQDFVRGDTLVLDVEFGTNSSQN